MTVLRAIIAFVVVVQCVFASLGQGESRKSHPVPRFMQKIENAVSARSCKVITDIDDTVVSSGGHTFCGIMIGGVDNQYKHGEFYPGVTQFGLELALSKQLLPMLLRSARRALNLKQAVGHEDKSIHAEPSPVSVLTARAKELKFAMALKPTSKVCKAYHHRGTSHGLPDWGVGDVQYGSLAEWVLSHRRGWRKAKNFGQMVRDGERVGDSRKYVFIGDTGDRDEDAAERMATAYPQKLKAVFLHTVYPVAADGSMAASKVRRAKDVAHVSPGSPMTPLPREQKSVVRADRTVNGVPIYYFRTYVGAAVKAYQANLIDLAAVKRVAVQAAADMRQHEKHARERLITAQSKLQEKEMRLQRQWWRAARGLRGARGNTASATDDKAHPLTAAAPGFEITAVKGLKTNQIPDFEANLRSKWLDLCHDAEKLERLLCFVKRPLTK